jgi:hypothetical protein
VPAARSVKVIGTSTSRSPASDARQVFSIWKLYPFEAEPSAPIASRASRRNALNPAVLSRTPVRSIIRT